MHSIRSIAFILASALMYLPEKASGQSDSGLVPLSTAFRGIDRNLLGSFTHAYGAMHLGAWAGTYAMIETRSDWEIYKFAHRNPAVQWAGFPSVIVGGLVPMVVPLSLYYVGRSRSDVRLQRTGLALGQAAILGWFISSSYKAISARKPPDAFETDIPDKDFSNDFKWGFMRRGIFDGWPSGHTTTAFAMATTLRELYPENRAIRRGALIYAFAVGIGISTNIHWTSDFVAGALIGYSIGKSVEGGLDL